MEKLVYNTLAIAFAAAFVLGLLRKWGAVEWLQIHGNGFFSKMANCDFCLSWWAGVLASLAALAITGDWSYLLVPFCSTMLTRALL